MENQKTMRNVIISGPTGVLGHSLIEELTSGGTAVTAVCRPGSPRNAALPKSPLLRVVDCALNEYSRLPNLLAGERYDAFFHFAWDGTYGKTRDDLALQTANVTHSIEAVQIAADLGCGVFVGAGSQAEYGTYQGVLSPDTPCFPETGYGVAKLAAKSMTRIACSQRGIRQVWCRIISLYGPWDGEHTMVMSSILKMLRGEYARFTKAEQDWDYLHGRDAARAFLLAAEKGKDGAVYCVGSGKTRKLSDFILAMRDAVDPGLSIGIGELPYYPNQVFHLEADISPLTADTGFVPSVSFEDGIRETVQWAKEHFIK